MNCLFTLKHKETEQIVNIYGHVIDEYGSGSMIRFIVWNNKYKMFSYIKSDEFEPCSSAYNGDYTPPTEEQNV